MSVSSWDVEADVVVLGSGGGALMAAIAARDFGAEQVVVVEKSNMVGGTTAMSGGMLWIPNNQYQQDEGIDDSWDEVVTYLDSLAPDQLDPEVLEGFLMGGPEMVRHLTDRTPVRFRTMTGFPDYQPDAPGAKVQGGRTLDSVVFPFSELGNWATRVVPPKSGPPLLTTYYENAHFGKLDADIMDERKRTDSRGQGQALIGGLLKAVLDRDIEFYFEHRAMKLHKEGNRIVGVSVETPDGERNFQARRGVVIATGGFEWNKDLVQTFLRGPMTGPVSVPENEGDGLIMAIEAGAKLGNMSNAFWMTSTLEGKQQHRDAKPNYLLCQNERVAPGSILVNRLGRRFVNEATNYNILGLALHDFDPNTHDYPNQPYYLIFDQRFRERYPYPIFGNSPGEPLSEMFYEAESLEALADLLEVDSDGLVATVARFNDLVESGHDDDFQRGDNAFDNYWGDKGFEPPYCTLGCLDQPPYFGVKMEAGVLGTNGGPKTNGHGQVVDWQNQPIQGLYCTGNAMAAPLGMVYGGGGGTLGPALTFGYLSGKHAASETV
ncbi:MAG: FAD-binding protein [Gammaproteobacteria bacterium]|jgi:3-oxosteroid 1-dehydrogenase|nr:FAD-binding protein [Gammaproteobacteria bacterium]MBT7369201.1 FAD-binding protein [Gammaproteobacteria bacterium]